MSSQPKRPVRPGSPPPLPKETREVELPFEESEVTPLRVDDPRPQRVPQYPANARRKGAPDQADTEIFRMPTAELASLPEPEYRPVFIYVERGPGAGQLVPIRQGKIVLGRSSTADLRLQHPSISRRHAELRREGERFLLRDLGSQNGTYVNRAKLGAGDRELFVGDVLALGTAVLKLRGPLGPQDVEVIGAESRSSALKIAIFACAVAFGLAGIFLVALMQLQKPTQVVVQAPAPAVTQTRSAPAQSGTPLAVATPTAAPAGPAQSPPGAAGAAASNAVAGSSAEEPSAEQPPAASAQPSGEQADTEVPEASTRPPAAHHAISHRAHHVSHHQGVRRIGQALPEPVPTDPSAAYRQGDLALALSLARQTDPSLAHRIEQFEQVYGEARKAIADDDSDTARRRLTTALALDEEIAQGEGSLNKEIRSQLAKLDAGVAAPPPADRAARPKNVSTVKAKARAKARSAIDAAFGD